MPTDVSRPGRTDTGPCHGHSLSIGPTFDKTVGAFAVTEHPNSGHSATPVSPVSRLPRPTRLVPVRDRRSARFSRRPRTLGPSRHRAAALADDHCPGSHSPSARGTTTPRTASRDVRRNSPAAIRREYAPLDVFHRPRAARSPGSCRRWTIQRPSPHQEGPRVLRRRSHRARHGKPRLPAPSTGLSAYVPQWEAPGRPAWVPGVLPGSLASRLVAGVPPDRGRPAWSQMSCLVPGARQRASARTGACQTSITIRCCFGLNAAWPPA